VGAPDAVYEVCRFSRRRDMVISSLGLLAHYIFSCPSPSSPTILHRRFSLAPTWRDAQTLEQAVATPSNRDERRGQHELYVFAEMGGQHRIRQLIRELRCENGPNTHLILTQARETQAASQLRRFKQTRNNVERRIGPAYADALYSPHGTYMPSFWQTTASINIPDPITRRRHRQRSVFGAGQYAMRLWVKPDQLQSWVSPFPKSSAHQAQE